MKEANPGEELRIMMVGGKLQVVDREGRLTSIPDGAKVVFDGCPAESHGLTRLLPGLLAIEQPTAEFRRYGSDTQTPTVVNQSVFRFKNGQVDRPVPALLLDRARLRLSS